MRGIALAQIAATQTVRSELVEGLPLFSWLIAKKKGQGFDNLSPNGV
jgi:hypothetical protein